MLYHIILHDILLYYIILCYILSGPISLWTVAENEKYSFSEMSGKSQKIEKLITPRNAAYDIFPENCKKLTPRNAADSNFSEN